MVKIYQHIEKLLAFHDYVVVPELGGFVVQMQSAVILSDKIKPPLASIGFNPLMQHADGLLAIEIARSEGITYRKAMEIIELEVESIKKQLSDLKTVKFGNIGHLAKDDSGNLLFTPVENASFLPVNIGLNDIFINEIQPQTTINEQKTVFRFEKSSFFRYAAAVVIFGFLLISPQVNDVKQEANADLMSISFAALPELIVTPNQCPELEVEKEFEVQEIKTVLNDKDLYHVIVASLPSQKSADKYCEALKLDKFECAHVLAPICTYRVAVQSFEDKDEAIQYMINLRKSDQRFESAWVLCK